MRLPTGCGAGWVRLAAVALLALTACLVEAPRASAQWGDYDDDAPVYAPRRRVYREEPAPRRSAPQPEPQRSFFWPWEDRPQERPQAAPRPRPVPSPGYARPQQVPQRARPPAVAGSPDTRGRTVRQHSVPPAQAAQTAPAVPKTAPNIQVAVFGDSLASYLAKGLNDDFADNPNVAVIDRSRGDSGIVRKDVVDWAKAADDFLKANPKVGYALFMVGVNDRQAIREGGETYEPLTDKWREAYAARVEAIVKVFTEHKVPLIWISVPPVRFEGLTRDLATINDIAREPVQKAGQTYVDIWPGFVDDRNRYTATGPDLDGQRALLRTQDGIHFTNPGARKLAHFADVDLKRIMGANGALPPEPPAQVSSPPGDGPAEAAGQGQGGSGAGSGLDDTAALDRRITGMLPSLPEPAGVPSLPVKPAAGPVTPLGRAEISPGGQLISGRSREGDALGTNERSLVRGAAPMPQPGRADDFKWPPS